MQQHSFTAPLALVIEYHGLESLLEIYRCTGSNYVLSVLCRSLALLCAGPTFLEPLPLITVRLRTRQVRTNRPRSPATGTFASAILTEELDSTIQSTAVASKGSATRT